MIVLILKHTSSLTKVQHEAPLILSVRLSFYNFSVILGRFQTNAIYIYTHIHTYTLRNLFSYIFKNSFITSSRRKYILKGVLSVTLPAQYR